MSKIVTAVAVMQLVERGILSLDKDVRENVPELATVHILQDMKEGIYFRSAAQLSSLVDAV